MLVKERAHFVDDQIWRNKITLKERGNRVLCLFSDGQLDSWLTPVHLIQPQLPMLSLRELTKTPAYLQPQRRAWLDQSGEPGQAVTE